MLKFRSAAALAALSVVACSSVAHAQTLQEGTGQWNLALIHADAAASRGYTGQGVVVGVLDSGIDVANADLTGQMSGISHDVATGGAVTDDPDGHGTHVAGIIAAARDGSRVQGVAYEAQLAAFRLPPAGLDYPATDQLLGEAIMAALDRGVTIINNSWGWDFYLGDFPAADVLSDLSGQIAAFRAVAAADGVMIFATGNEYQTQPNLQAGMPFYAPELQSHWLAVTAVGPTSQIASYANHCGDAAAWCLAAPGGEINTNNFGDQIISDGANGGLGGSGLDIKAGTSMAAPHVTGAVAIARQMFPDAPAAALTRLVLTTATDLGDVGVDETYGWGLLNLENMVSVRDAEAGSVFANGVWAVHSSQSALIETLDGRLSGPDGAGGWAALIGGRAEHETTGSALASKAETFGAAVGYDFDTAENTRLGLTLSTLRADADEAGGANRARIRSIGLSAYAAARRGRLFADASTGLDIRQYDFRRREILGADGTVLEAAGTLDGRSESDGYGVFARARVGAAFDLGAFKVKPFIHARLSHHQIDAFAETGADVFSQNVGETDVTVYEAGPGVELATLPHMVGGNIFAASLSVRYDARGGDDDFAVPVGLLGSDVPARVGELDDAVAVAGGVSAQIAGGWEASARGWWSGGDDHDSTGAVIGLRLAF